MNLKYVWTFSKIRPKKHQATSAGCRVKTKKSYNSPCNTQPKCKGYFYRIMWISKFYSGSKSIWTFLQQANELKAIRWEFQLGSKKSLSSRLTETTSQGITTTHPPLATPPGTHCCQTCCLIWFGHFYTLRETALLNEVSKVLQLALTKSTEGRWKASALFLTEANRMTSSLFFSYFWIGHKDILSHKLIFQLQLQITYIR